ncbi:MAG: pyridoxal phosphate-dependent aminotransferase [Candidatus Eisenbacteria bacterium]
MGGLTISRRGESVPPSPIRKLVPLADETRRRGVHVHGLNIGQPDIPTPDCMWEALRRDLPRTLAYSPSGGIPELREAFSGYYARHGIGLSSNEILVTSGGSEAILFAIGAIADPGEEVLIPEPLYANYLGFSRFLGVQVAPITCDAANGYHLPPAEEWEKRITPKTRAILLCNPGNPTGTVYEESEVAMVRELALRHDLYLVVDEVYREFCYDGRKHRSMLTLPGIEDRVILVDSISKRFSACGARIGCLATRAKPVFDTAMKFAQARLSPPGLGQIAAVPALSLPESYYQGFVREFEARRNRVMEILEREPSIRCRRPRGAFYVMATLPVDDAESYVRWMLTEYQKDGETVMVAPGDGFYATPGMGKQEIRLAYVFEEKVLSRAVSILVESLAHYPGRRR